MNDFKNDFVDYCLSGHAMLSVRTHEKDRAIDQIREAAAEMGRNVFVWSIATGWRDKDGEQVADQATGPEVAIQDLPKLDEDSICVFKDFGYYLDHQTYPQFDIVIAWLDEIKQAAANMGQTLVFAGADFKIPNPLKHDITEMDFDLPDKEQIEKQIRFVCEGVENSNGDKFEPSEDMIPEIINACRGMTQQQVLDRVALALRKNKDLNDLATQTILKEKATVIKSSGLLTYMEPPEGGLDNVGGYQALKDHVELDKPCFSEEAREFGIEFPKGLLLVGIPGCGKTLLSLAIASEFGLPLISMDIGNVMSKYVGDSEANMREAIKVIERIAPCVLQLDEIEKGFGGSGDMDGGSSRRVFGTFIKWLNDRTSPVYTVATANEVQSLPPEFARKGRFDEIFGMDLPKLDERKVIFDIHFKKRGRSRFTDVALTKFAEESDGFTGADIEQAVKLSLKIAFSREEDLDMPHALEAIKSIVPLSKTEPGRIKNIREWCDQRAKQANPTIVDKQVKTRKVTV